MRRALVVGGTGLGGRAIAERLATAGWEVTVAARGHRPPPPGTAMSIVDCTVPGALQAAVGNGVDLLVLGTGFAAREVIALGDRIGAVVALSSASLYVDGSGRAMGGGDPESFPDLPVPVPEHHPVAGPRAEAERLLLDGCAAPVSVLRLGLLSGPWTDHGREWYFLERALDRRPVFVHAYGGGHPMATTTVDNLAEAVRLAAERPGTRVLNCADPDPVTPVEVARAICAYAGHEPEELLLPGPPQAGVGASPWSAPRPFVLDCGGLVRELGYRPVTTFREGVGRTCRWLESTVDRNRWEQTLPRLAAYPLSLFDYQAEDAIRIRYAKA
jgi:nucleoside-diphosphate-sugar epimerase